MQAGNLDQLVSLYKLPYYIKHNNGVHSIEVVKKTEFSHKNVLETVSDCFLYQLNVLKVNILPYRNFIWMATS